MSYWKLTRNQSTRVIPADCQTINVWVPAYDPNGDGSGGEYCTNQIVNQVLSVYQFFPDDPDDDYGGVYETSSGGAPASNYNGVEGEWVLIGVVPANVLQEICNTGQVGAPPPPEVIGLPGPSGEGMYVQVERCTPPREELYDGMNWAEVCESENTYTGSFEYTFNVPNGGSTGIITGLHSAHSAPGSYHDLTHAIYAYRAGFSGTRIRAMESGVSVGGSAPVGEDEVIMIRRLAGKVEYLLDGEVFHTSTVVSGGEQQMFAYLYSISDEVQNAEVNEIGEGRIDVSMSVFDAQTYGDDVTDDFILAEMMPFDADLEGVLHEGNIDTEMMILDALGFESPTYALIDASMMSFDADATESNEVQPIIAVIDAAMTFVDAQGYGGTTPHGTMDDLAVMPFTAQAIEQTTYAYIDASLMPLDGDSLWFIPLENVGRADLTAPQAEIFSLGSSNTARAGLVAPAGSIYAEFDGVAYLTAPSPTIMAAADYLEIAVANLVAPQATTNAIGTVNALAIANLEMVGVAATIAAFGGGEAALTAPQGYVSSLATLVGLALGDLEAPTPLISANGVVNALATAALLAPAGTLSSGGIALLTAPSAYIEAVADILRAHGTSIAMNVATGGLSTYDIGFKAYFRIGDLHYGVGDDNVLYLITGTDDDGADIDIVAETQSTDFGQEGKIRAPTVFLTAKTGNTGLDVLTVQDYTDLWRYRSGRFDHTHYQKKRVRPGQGLKATKWAVRVENIDGEATAIESISPQIMIKPVIAEK